MDNLFYSLKETQSEKLCLEQKLHEQKRIRHSSEAELDQESAKCSQIQEKHMRLADTHAIAEQKVEQSIKEVLSLQAEVDSKRPKMENNQQEIEMEKQDHTTRLFEFQNTLSEVAGDLFNAKKFHRKDNLNGELQRLLQVIEELDQEIVEMSDNAKHLTNTLEKLDKEVETEIFKNNTMLLACCGAFEKDKADLKEELSHVKEESESLHQAMEKLQ